MQQFVINRVGKNLLVIKEMQFLPVRQCDLPMPSQKIMERGRARFLRPGDNKIEPFHLSTFPTKHYLTYHRDGQAVAFVDELPSAK